MVSTFHLTKIGNLSHAVTISLTLVHPIIIIPILLTITDTFASHNSKKYDSHEIILK